MHLCGHEEEEDACGEGDVSGTACILLLRMLAPHASSSSECGEGDVSGTQRERVERSLEGLDRGLD